MIFFIVGVIMVGILYYSLSRKCSNNVNKLNVIVSSVKHYEIVLLRILSFIIIVEF